MNSQFEEVDLDSPDLNLRTVFAPSFLLLSEGMAVLIRNQPTVSAALELQGPVIRWGALLRAGILQGASPVARLWKDDVPLPAGEPACIRFFKPRWSARIPVSERPEAAGEP